MYNYELSHDEIEDTCTEKKMHKFVLVGIIMETDVIREVEAEATLIPELFIMVAVVNYWNNYGSKKRVW